MKYFFLLFSLPILLAACSTTQHCIEKMNPDCICTMQYDPVCGCNNKTYGNACAAECSGIKKYTPGPCPDAAPVALEVIQWKLLQFTGNEVKQVPATVDINILLKEGKLSGKGGCNRIGGQYTLDKQQITFTGIMSTKMFCENAMDWETMFLNWLDKAQQVTVSGNTLEISCPGAGVLVFSKQ